MNRLRKKTRAKKSRETVPLRDSITRFITERLMERCKQLRACLKSHENVPSRRETHVLKGRGQKKARKREATASSKLCGVYTTAIKCKISPSYSQLGMDPKKYCQDRHGRYQFPLVKTRYKTKKSEKEIIFIKGTVSRDGRSRLLYIFQKLSL